MELQTKPNPTEVVPAVEPEAAEPESSRPLWGTHATFWQWLAVLGVSAVFLALVHRITSDAVAAHGHAAFPSWLWDVYDWRVWPLRYFR